MITSERATHPCSRVALLIEKRTQKSANDESVNPITRNEGQELELTSRLPCLHAEKKLTKIYEEPIISRTSLKLVTSQLLAKE